MIDTLYYNKFIQVIEEGVRLNWHERNSGNLTYMLTDEEVKDSMAYFKDSEDTYDLPLSLPYLVGKYFLITGSGQFFMNATFATDEVMGVITVVENGDKYKIVHGFDNDNRPTSELPTHLSMMEKFVKDKSDNCVVYHCHPTHLNALTYTESHNSYEFSAELWKMSTEAAVIFPNGVGILKWMMPGSLEIGAASVELLDEFDAVVWVHHGIFAVGDSLDNTAGLVAVIEKSAQIKVLVQSSNKTVTSTIIKQDIVDLGHTFNIALNPKVVDKL